MFYTHGEYYTFPNTIEGRFEAENWVSILQRHGINASINATTVDITVAYEETIVFKPPELEVMHEPEKEVTNDA